MSTREMCTLGPGRRRPLKDGDTKSCTGSGWAPQNIQITIQRYKGYGFWQNVLQDQTGYTYNAYDSMTKYYSCQGTGDWDYRTVIDAWVSGGAQVAHGQSRLYYEVIC